MNKNKYFAKVFNAFSKVVQNKGSLTICTGANAPFYESMRDNLLASIVKYEPKTKLVIWDLGLLDSQLSELQCLAKKWGGVIYKFPFEELSEHYAMDKQNYAFKSYCIMKTMCFCSTDYLLWLDAGCGIVNRLDAERNIMKMYGIYSPYSSTTVSQLTLPGVMSEYAEGIIGIGNKPMLSPGCVGVNLHDTIAVGIITRWYHECALPNLLSPVGSSKKNHRQDQSLFSLAYYSIYSTVPVFARRWINIRFHLNKNLEKLHL